MVLSNYFFLHRSVIELETSFQMTHFPRCDKRSGSKRWIWSVKEANQHAQPAAWRTKLTDSDIDCLSLNVSDEAVDN